MFSNHIDVEISHSRRWDEDSGIESWYVEASIRSDDESVKVVIATASLWRVDLQVCTEFCLELDNISCDLGEIASAMLESKDQLAEYSIVEGERSSILIAEDVAVDKFWRGIRLGPALLFFAAETMRPDGIFLTPVALGTRLDSLNVCVTDYGARRPGPAAQKKVETAWRRAGFRKLFGDVVWIPISHDCLGNGPNHRKLTRKAIKNIEIFANGPRARAWLKRRIRRHTGSIH